MKTQTQLSGHTQGEWGIIKTPNDLDCYGEIKNVCAIFRNKNSEANSQRIIECVNAMDGIEHPIEYIKAKKALDACKNEEINSLMDKNDNLLATIKEMLKEAEDACRFHGNNPNESPDILKWRKALKQAEQK